MEAMGLSPWLPTVTERHRWSDRWKEVVRPLFPGYLFARVGQVEWHRVLKTPGVLTVVKKNGGPALLSDDFVAGLRDALMRDGVAPQAMTEAAAFEPGDEVVIVQEGPLAGIRGIVSQRLSARQLVIWVSEIGRGVAFTIGSALVQPAMEKSGTAGRVR